MNDFIKRQGQTELKTFTLNNEALRRLQQVELSIVDDIADYCNRNSIDWSLSGGSVLGAVRHEGFIPWDDDIDLNMTRAEWEKFYPGFQKEYSEKYWLFSPDTCSNCNINAIRVIKKGTKLQELSQPNDDGGIFIDIFVIENVPNSLLLRTLHGIKCEAFRYICSCVRYFEQRDHIAEVFANNDEALRSFGRRIAIGRIFSFAPARFWAAAANDVNKEYNDKPSNWLSIPTGVKRYFGELIAKDDYFPMRKLKFEGREWYVPGNYSCYLENLYGNWKKIPEPSEREQHILLALDFGDGE